MAVWLRALTELERGGEAAVLVTVLSARGSTPREAGCKMVVTAHAQHDTIGGGSLEFTCVGAARELLTGGDAPVLRDFPLGPSLGQCCGGHVSVLFEPIRPRSFRVAIFGAGHVGRALAGLLSSLPLRVTLIDTRAEALSGLPPEIAALYTEDPAREAAALPARTLVLVMTHDHQIDFDIVAAALRRRDLAAVGLIGSDTKRARFVRRLARLGLPAGSIEALICPIGIAGAGGKLPAEIAISVAAQILQIQQSQQKAVTPMKTPERLQDGPDECGDCSGICANSGTGARRETAA